MHTTIIPERFCQRSRERRIQGCGTCEIDKVGRPDIDAFEAVMEREGEGGRQRGFFVAFGYTKDAQDECNAFFKRTGRIIKLLTVQEILDEEHVQKM
jgi:hypothetical protein